jgi:hypothetical protein
MKTSPPKPARYDDGLEWLREIRRKLSAECNHDPFEMGRRLREREKEYKGRIFTTKRVLVPVDDLEKD